MVGMEPCVHHPSPRRIGMRTKRMVALTLLAMFVCACATYHSLPTTKIVKLYVPGCK